jgi:RecA-family ATPase
MHNAKAPMDFAELAPEDVVSRIAAAAPVGSSEIETLDLARLATIEPLPKSFVIPRLAPAGEVTLFTGPGSAGKSLLAQQLATALAAGVPTLRLDMGQAPAIYLTCEDDAEQLHWRQAHIAKALGVSMESLAGKLFLASLRGHLDNALGTIDPMGAFTLSMTYERVAALIRRTGARLVALDNVAHLFAGNENDRGEVTQFVNALNRLAGETGAAILLLGHPNKSGDSYSGSTAWLNAVRSQIFLEHDQDTDLRTLTVGKANYARKGEAITFAWLEWAFMLDSDLPPDAARAMTETVQANGENTAFLRCLEACTAQRRNVSHQPGINYAPKIFADLPQAKGIKQKGFKAAMERLLHLGQIELDRDLWLGKDRHPKRGIMLAETSK